MGLRDHQAQPWHTSSESTKGPWLVTQWHSYGHRVQAGTTARAQVPVSKLSFLSTRNHSGSLLQAHGQSDCHHGAVYFAGICPQQAGETAVPDAAAVHVPADPPGEPTHHFHCAVLLLSSHLQRFLCKLSILDIFFTLVISPKVLVNLASGNKTISFSGYFTQCYFYSFLGTVEFLLLTVMSYGCYAAVCYPLQYSTIMRPSVCIVFSWVGGFLSVLFPNIFISQLPFCGSNIINHFFCDSGPLLALACADTTAIELMDFMLSSTVILCCIVPVAYSYMYIILTIVCISSSSGRKKAFNTCASHLTIVMVSSGITVFIYVTPSQKEYP